MKFSDWWFPNLANHPKPLGYLVGIQIPGLHPRPGEESNYLIPAPIFIKKHLRYFNDLEISYRLPDTLLCLIYVPRKKGKEEKQNYTGSLGRKKILERRF